MRWSHSLTFSCFLSFPESHLAQHKSWPKSSCVENWVFQVRFEHNLQPPVFWHLGRLWSQWWFVFLLISCSMYAFLCTALMFACNSHAQRLPSISETIGMCYYYSVLLELLLKLVMSCFVNSFLEYLGIFVLGSESTFCLQPCFFKLAIAYTSDSLSLPLQQRNH